ncbi:MAG: C40 family peptidase [Clostridiales bacterium]|nr:C40 family peptidase [Clostridiales bacterium]
MSRKKIFKTSVFLSAALLSLGLSKEVSAHGTIGSDVGIAGITPIIESYYSSNLDQQNGEAEAFLINLLLQLDQANGTKLTQIISPYANLGISTANNYVNIRTEPNTESEIVGKLYSGCATDILGTEGDWVKIKSGKVEGYIKAEYLAIGLEAEGLIEEVAEKYAVIKTQTLYVREEPTTESSIVTMVPIDEKYYIEEELEDWAKIAIDDITGYVSKDYIDVEVEFDYAISIEEELARIAAEEAARQAEEERLAALAREEAARKEAERKAREKAEKAAKATSQPKQTQAATEATTQTQAPAQTEAPKQTQAPATSSQGSAKGQEIANYAVKFVGNPYVYGGTSLTNGADCSGFVYSIFKHFGYSVARSSASQAASTGYEVSLSDRQPGDLIFYTKNGRVNHVAIYIGNNQVVHASNPKSGIKISAYNYRTPYKIKRVVK